MSSAASTIELQRRIAEITRELKATSSNSKEYEALWNERADLHRKLSEINGRSTCTEEAEA